MALAEGIGDRQAICDSRLILAEAHLRNGDTDKCSQQLAKVRPRKRLILPTDLGFAGEAQRLLGMLAMLQI